ncbi:MAG: DUF2007 domain-containing protein [Saprospiraceae bacterium]|nr:DUF2007 domain-containing protein [Saprospiraceae bacterium]
MVADWVRVYRSEEEYQAVLIRELLENYDLHPVLMDRKDDEFRIGYAEVYVAPEESERARQIIEENQKP